MTQNQVQIVFMIKSIEASEVMLATHLTHQFTLASISFYSRFLSQKTQQSSNVLRPTFTTKKLKDLYEN